MSEFEFAGEIRKFELKPSRYSRYAKEASFDSIGSLAELFRKAHLLDFKDSEVRHLLAHALAGPDNPVKLAAMRELVDAEMEGKPIGAYLAIVSKLISEALTGPDDGDQIHQQGNMA